jgi:hypothetical protein
MKTDSGLPVSVPPPGRPLRRRILAWPSTRLGWWSVALATTFVLLYIITPTLPILSQFPLAVLSWGLAAGIVGLIAVIRRQERSGLVWFAMLPGLMVLLLVLGEFLAPH